MATQADNRGTGGEGSRVIRVVHGDLLKQNVEILVNPWNRNIIPYWLLLPGGVSGALLKAAGREPFRELSEAGSLPLGGATLTGPGRMKDLKGIVHVAVLDFFWRASLDSVRESAQNAMQLVNRLKFGSVAFPLLGAGVGGLDPEEAYQALTETLTEIPTEAAVRIVRYRRETAAGDGKGR